MTAILSWFNIERNTYPYIMTAGDTKISDTEGTLTLEGAKILELPIRCKDLTTQYQDIYFSSSIGFSFAGSTIVGLNVYCYLLTVFSNLGGNSKAMKLPDYVSICEKTKEILTIYTSSIRSVAEVLLFGFCPKTKMPFIATIKPTRDNDEIVYKTEIKTEFEYLLQYEIIGDKKDEIRSRINERIFMTKDIDTFDYWRIPAQVLKEIIQSNEFETMGGNLQICTCNQVRFETYATVILNSNSSSLPSMKFRNIDVFEDVGKYVGDCIVAINGIMIDKMDEK